MTNPTWSGTEYLVSGSIGACQVDGIFYYRVYITDYSDRATATSSDPNDHFLQPIVTVDLIPGSTFFLLGKILATFDYSTKKKIKYHSTINNIKYVICIDASTCIAAPDASTGVYKLTLSDFLGAGTSAPPLTVLGSSNIVGLAKNRGGGNFVIATSSNSVMLVNDDSMSIIVTLSLNHPISFLAGTKDGNVVISGGDAIYYYNFLTNPSYWSGATPMVKFVPSASNTHQHMVATSLAEWVTMIVNGESKVYVYEKKPCHTSCATCSGPGVTDCLVCIDLNVPMLGQACATACDPSCQLCVYGDPHSCFSCPSSKYLEDVGGAQYDCVPCNQPGQVINADRCLPCAQNCSVCNSYNQTECSSCMPSFYMDDDHDSCSSCNQPGQVIVSTKCKLCGPNCKTCNPSNLAMCYTCITGNYLFADNTCKPCDITSISTQMIDGIRCIICNSKCDICNPANLNECTSCFPGYYSRPDGTCILCNTAGFYISGPSCKNCDSSCKTCSDATTCDSCLSGSCLNESRACISSTGIAQNMYLYNDGIDKCARCDSTCKTCLGSSTSCTSCDAGRYLSSSACLLCNPNCLTCLTTSTYCLTCDSTKSLSLSISNTCIICGAGNFTNTDGKCLPCNSPCLLCGANNGDLCYSCVPDNFYHNDINKCDLCTSSGFGKYGTECLHCDSSSNCKRCDSTTVSICTECGSSDYLRLDSGNKCTSDCPSTNYYFTNGSVTYCDLCNANCLTCSGPTDLECTSCFAPKVLSAGRCVRCSTDCIMCTNETTCTECRLGRSLTSTAICIESCSKEGWYKSGRLCWPCDANCKSCFGSAASCTSCIAGQYLSATNTCVPCTENGYYHNSTNCLQCDSSCLTCNGSTSTDCLTCPDGFELTPLRSCRELQIILVKNSLFRSDIRVATFEFSSVISPRLQPATTHISAALYSCENHTDPRILRNSPDACFRLEEGWRMEKLVIQTKKLSVHLTISQEVEDATLLVRLDQKRYLVSPISEYVVYPEDYLIVENVTVIKSALDGMMDSAGTAAAVIMLVMEVVVMGVSIPQAVGIFKMLQTLDYYLYIDCSFPENVSGFLGLITNSPYDFSPNIFTGLADDLGNPVYERLDYYGYKVHFFYNAGPTLTIVVGLLALKICLALVGFLWARLRKVHNKVDAEVLISTIEGSNLELVLSILIYVGQRDQINHLSDAAKYLVIVFVSLFSLFMISMYLFMGYTVSRLTDSYFKHAIIDVRDMKDEPFKFWLEDKNMHGNIFQRHFNLIQLFKDIVFAALLYALYYKPLVLIILLTLIQAVFMACVFAYPPYNIAWMNKSLKTTQLLYLIVDLHFLVLIVYGNRMTQRQRYNYVGYSMIATLAGIFATNLGFMTYLAVKELIERFRNWNKKTKQTPEKSDLRTDDTQDFSRINLAEVSPSKTEPQIRSNIIKNSNLLGVRVLKKKAPEAKKLNDSNIEMGEGGPNATGSSRAEVVVKKNYYNHKNAVKPRRMVTGVRDVGKALYQISQKKPSFQKTENQISNKSAEPIDKDLAIKASEVRQSYKLPNNSSQN